MIRIRWQCFPSGIALWAMAVVLVTGGGGARADTRLGNMICKRISDTGFNLIIHSSAAVRCTFKGGVDAEQWYLGKIGVALGLDLKWNKEEAIYFGILSSTVKFVPGGDFLSGDYVGAEADTALGLGVGAAVLMSGGNDAIALQPAVEASTGLGVAAGLSYLNLEPDPLNKARLVTPRGELFAVALYSSYFDAAYKYYHRSDYQVSDYFSGKAMAASSGTAPAPDAVTKWKLPDAQRRHASAIRGRLVSAIETPTGKVVDAAKAQVNFDCWLREAASGVSSETLISCRDALNVHLRIVETAVAQQLTENNLMQPTWFRILFDVDSATLDKIGVRVIDDVWKRVAQLAGGRVFVMGNTDRSGSTKYNLDLSEKRADTVEAALVGFGVPRGWITPVSYGEHNPMSLSAHPHIALNRQVDILVEPIQIKQDVIEEEAKNIAPR